MKEKIIYYFYNMALKGWENYLILLLGIIIPLVLIYAITLKIVKTKYKSKYDLFKKMVNITLLLIFVVLAYMINLVINYAIPVNAIYENPFSFMTDASYYRINDDEYIRCLIELISYIPIGICLYMFIKSRKMLKVLLFSGLLSVAFELFSNKWSISRYYWITLINNLLGVLTGIGILTLVLFISKKQVIGKKQLIASQFPVLVSLVIYVVMYLLYFTNSFRNIYPEYYEEIDAGGLNVSVAYDKTLDKSRYNEFFSEKECNEFLEKVFSLYGTSIDETKTKSYEIENAVGSDLIIYKSITNAEQNVFCQITYKNEGIDCKINTVNNNDNSDVKYTSDEFKELLKQCGIIVPEKSEFKTWESSCRLSGWYEIADGLYCDFTINMSFDGEGRPNEISISTPLYSGITLNGNRLDIRRTFGYQNTISPEEAYEKLCAGECYAEGLVEATQNGKIDVKVNNVRMVLHTDNLNCRQYVYCFDVEPIEVEGQAPITKIYVPAMNNNKLLRNRFSQYIHEH